MEQRQFECYLIEKQGSQIERGLARRTLADLPPGDCLVQVRYSSLNYKDALACQAHPGVVRKLPHVPGIDAAGTIVESADRRYRPGDEVVITGHEFGSGQWGGWAQLARLPADWIVPLPAELSLFEAMALGTAGFTAAQCVQAIELNGVTPDAGEIVVTGATGGVGSLAVRILSKLGYQVVAVTGKPQLTDRLKQWGASRVIGRGDVLDESDKPLLAGRWAGAVDTVGGGTLATLVRETKPYGVVSACGLVGGTDLDLTVHPFILRGVVLAGIGSALVPYDRRREIWRKLSHEWRIDGLDELATTVPLTKVEAEILRILRGEIVGRTVVEIPG